MDLYDDCEPPELTPKLGVVQFLDEFHEDLTIENMGFQVLVKRK